MCSGAGETLSEQSEKAERATLDFFEAMQPWETPARKTWWVPGIDPRKGRKLRNKQNRLYMKAGKAARRGKIQKAHRLKARADAMDHIIDLYYGHPEFPLRKGTPTTSRTMEWGFSPLVESIVSDLETLKQYQEPIVLDESAWFQT